VALVTSNLGKLKEFQHGLEPLGLKVRHLSIECDEVQADRLEDVVRSCIAQVVQQGHEDFILDDSGLFIDHLKGFPGVYSSYVHGTLGCPGILRLLEGASDRSAHFECCIGCHFHDAGRIIVSGSSPGRIGTEQRGTKGFGYDPIFIPDGGSGTFAEMDLEEKNRFSHRGAAMRAFVTELRNNLPEGKR
jgi:XTP/dITP diphosphohydrolase